MDCLKWKVFYRKKGGEGSYSQQNRRNYFRLEDIFGVGGEETHGFIMQIASPPLGNGKGPQWQITSGQIGADWKFQTCWLRAKPSFSSVQFSCSAVSDSLLTPWLQQARLPCPSPKPWACSSSSPSSRWFHPTISSSVVPFSSCLQSFPASGSFPMSQFFASGGKNIRASTSASVLPMNIQDWFPLGLTGLISLLSEGLSRSKAP